MKWVLVWMTLTASGASTSGTIEFQSLEACLKGQKNVARVKGDLSVTHVTMPFPPYTSLESGCISSETGEMKTGMEPALDRANRRRQQLQ
ncbi:hypothetical protein GMJLKIPL_5990 [Methylobacterium isbiliense]|uniref:Uncharacterized protein n=2 Tax=Methylobacterium isbiliense TaxID=315478 RepID=A0ABQ4SND5_9HYPH|nr:hypothetical protein GMJLKIPL_5990 [Methylobacterium isbiliense]